MGCNDGTSAPPAERRDNGQAEKYSALVQSATVMGSRFAEFGEGATISMGLVGAHASLHGPRWDHSMNSRLAYGLAFAAGLLFTAVPRDAAASQPRTHDGFFFRGSLGFGPGWVNESVESGAGEQELSMSGFTGMVELLFGGTPAPGFVIGGGLSGHSIVNPTVEFNDVEFETEDTSVGISQIAVFANYYPNAAGGLYLHGSLGYAAASVTVDGDTRDTEADGVSFGVGAGYDFWIGDEWSLGPQLRLTYAHMTGEEGGVEGTDAFLSPILALSVTYH